MWYRLAVLHTEKGRKKLDKWKTLGALTVTFPTLLEDYKYQWYDSNVAVISVFWDSSTGRVRAVMRLFGRRQRMRGNYFSEVNIALWFSYSSHSQTPYQSALTWSLHQCQQLMSCLSPSNHRFSPLITKQNQKAFEASEASSAECHEKIKGMY